MSRYEKQVLRLLGGNADRSFRFDDLCGILSRLGFEERRAGGSHHIFFRDGIAEILNLQPLPGGYAKPYQVRQVRNVIIQYELAAAAGRERKDEP